MNLKNYIEFSKSGGWFFSEEEQKDINTDAEMIFVLSEQKLSNNKTRIMNVIEEQNQKGLLGYSDWRLPTIAEVSKIVKNHLNFIKSSPLYTEEFITAEKGFFCIDSVGYICSAYFTSPTEKTTTSTGAQRVRFFS